MGLEGFGLVTVTQNLPGNNTGQEAEIGKVSQSNLEDVATNPAPWESEARQVTEPQGGFATVRSTRSARGLPGP